MIETKIRTNGDKAYTNFRGLNVPEDDVEWESFTIISIDSSLVYENKYHLQVYLDNYAYKIVSTEMVDLMTILMTIFLSLIIESYKCCIIIELI